VLWGCRVNLRCDIKKYRTGSGVEGGVLRNSLEKKNLSITGDSQIKH